MTTHKKHNRAPNSGSISINPSGSVRAQFVLPGGKRLTKAFPTKREADSWLRGLRNEVDAGLTTTNHDTLLSEFICDWLSRKKTQLRPKTFDDYSYYANNLIITHIGKLKLRTLKLHIVNDFYIDLADEGRPVHVIRYTHRVLHALLEDAVKLGFIPLNPAHYADIPTVEDGADKMQIFSISEYKCFVDACSTDKYGVLYKLAIKTGMRQGELLGLTWKNVDFLRGEIRIVQQISRYSENEQSFSFAQPKTKHSRRTITIGADLVEILKTHYQAQQTQKQFAGTDWKEYDLVFASSIGTPLDSRNMLRDFHELLKTAGLPKIRFHDLRHNAASMMLASKTSIVGVSRYLGHSSPQVTLSIYAHLVPGGFDEIVSAMNALPSASETSAVTL